MAEIAVNQMDSSLTLGGFARLPMRMKLAAGIAVAVAIAVIAAAWMWAKQPTYSVLFSNLSDQDGGSVIAALQAQNIPYQYSEGGGAILVPSTQVHDARLNLATQGLPKGGSVGFELIDNQQLGTSQFIEQINYQRALEGELARTIGTIAAVQSARVHLAIPKQSGFLRDEQKPAASVLVNLHSGRTLNDSQVAGIVHLVSSSVPELSPTAISVIDQNGTLVSQAKNNASKTGLDADQLKYVRNIESDYSQRVESLITPLVGQGNVKVQVTADIDFSQVDQVAESYRPNPTAEAAIRSQQTNETNSGAGSTGAAGVPGSLTNQPPAAATAPVTTNGAKTASNATSGNTTRNSTVNYELDKTIKHTTAAPGNIRRLAVAVLLNQKGDAKGKMVPLTDNEIKQITDLTREAVGISSQRGDTLNVTNAVFTETKTEASEEAPFWKDPFFIANAKDWAKYLAFIVVAWLIWGKLLKPFFAKLQEMATVTAPTPVAIMTDSNGAPMEQHIDENGHMVTTIPGYQAPGPTSYDVKLSQTRDMARQDPKVIAGVIKEWVNGESR